MSINRVLSYWFGEIRETEDYLKQRNALWFGKSQETDDDLRAHFQKDLEDAMAGKLDAWAITPRGRLALIVLLDQFSRNIYREKPKAFSQDPRALQLTLDGLDANLDPLLHVFERKFFYLPLMHAESLEIQKKSLHYFTQLVERVPKHLKASAEDNLTYAVRHYEIIQRFGRFPHRNLILKRNSTPEEIAFLKMPHSSF